ncbi:MAG: Fic family protein [Gammaproteobacteria bacterium]|nr:Fic family protein [Gammaproteobacteria bacterium]MYA68432.1 Fic family protein [Gammaproteobacteria bacterium]MYH45220.1 Fic family protein [Gammaproteobacteria bacterium]MYL12458.1 Fic family protein [Gammaproteobacteria bacterium]
MARSFDLSRPYNELPDLPPAAETETKAILKSCIAARAALAELRASGKLIPNQAMLINSIPLLEAQASSEIENIVTTADRLFRHANDATGRADPATKEALRYRTALNRGFEMLKRRPVATAMAVEVCRTIKGVDLDIRKVPGTALLNDATNKLIYTPPVGEDVIRIKLANWERYIHEAEKIDPLIRLAVMHYQFEAIHPFVDGNGRTGRVLNLLFLVDKGLLDIPVLYLSRYIIGNKALYYRHLLAVTTEQDWETWILFMLEAVKTTAEWTTAKIQAIRELLDETASEIRRKLPKIYSRELVELIFVNPYCRVNDVVKAGIGRRQTAAVYLNALAAEDILEKVKAGRENLYINPPLLALLSERT